MLEIVLAIIAVVIGVISVVVSALNYARVVSLQKRQEERLEEEWQEYLASRESLDQSDNQGCDADE